MEEEQVRNMIKDGECYESDNFVSRSDSTSAVTGEAHTVGLSHSMICVLCTTVSDEAELCQGSQLSFLAAVFIFSSPVDNL